jgi:cell division septal protein FtsQ
MVSYRKKHLKGKISKIKPRKSIFRKIWFWILLISVLFFCSVLYFLVFSEKFQVENIFVFGNEKTESQDLLELVAKNSNIELLNLYFWQLDSKSIFLASSKKINQQVLKDFPKIESAKLKKVFPKTLQLYIIERIPVGIYCENLDDENQQCFFVDKNGVVFENVYYGHNIESENRQMFIVRQDTEKGPVYLGQSTVEQNIILTLLKIDSILSENFQINLKEALITNPLRLNIKTNEGWEIYFNLDTEYNINSQITKLGFLLKDEIPKENRKILKYIDLRFKDRAQVMPREAMK